MMNSLFSVFEPSSSVFNMSLNWCSFFLGIFCLPYVYWGLPSRWLYLWSGLMSYLHYEFRLLLGSANSSASMVFVSLFALIVYNNFLGLFPYVFTSSGHLVVTLALSLPLWLTFMVFGWVNNTKHMFAHLVPQGTPSFLMPFMVVIETISNVIRPFTLAVRLAANMIAGHLLLALLGGVGPGSGFLVLFFLVLSQILLLVLESAVAVIQSYVFAALSTLYASEV